MEKKQTPIEELLKLIPDASDIKMFISENDADEKMLDEWLWERIFKGNDWVEKEKQVIVDAFIQGNREVFYDGTEEVMANAYYNNKYSK